MNKTIEDLRESLPVIVARSEVPRLLGGVISAGALANLDSRGQGPVGRVYVGRKAAYPKEALITWLEQRMSSEKAASVAVKGGA